MWTADNPVECIIYSIFSTGKFEFCAFAVSANLKGSCLSSETVVVLFFVCGGQLITYSSKSSFGMPSCRDFNHCFRQKKWNTANLEIYIFYLCRKGNCGKIIQSFVVRNSNLVQKMSPRRFLSFSPHHSNQTLVFIIHTTACKGNIRNNRRILHNFSFSVNKIFDQGNLCKISPRHT